MQDIQNTIPTNAINELISRSQTAAFSPLAELENVEQRTIDAGIKLEILKENTGVDITKVHCRKTGQPIATLNLTEIEHILNFYTATRLEEVAHDLDLAHGISRIWLHTSPDKLSKLQTVDPRGFFCYCIGIALRNHHMHYIANKKEFKTIDGERTFYNSLVKAWYATADIEPEVLSEANKVLRMFMFLDLHNKQFYRVPWQLMFSTMNNKFERVIFVKQNHSGGSTLSASIAYDPDKRPLLPEEFATQHGIDFIRFCVKKFLEQLDIKMEIDLVRYKHLHTANAFRRTRGYDNVNELDLQISDVSSLRHFSLSEVTARAKAIQEKMKKQTKAQVMDADFSLDLVIDSSGTIVTSESYVAPIQKPAAEQKPGIKLTGLKLF